MAAVMLVNLASCSEDEDTIIDDDDVAYMLPETKPVSLTQEQREMRDNNNAFACRLFQTVIEHKEKPGSTILSPISVSYLLGMINSGAAGLTREQITNVLGLGNSIQEINEYCKKMTDEVPLVDPNVTIKIANCIDINSAAGITLVPQYKTDMQQYYNAQVEVLDFTMPSSLDKINNWCSSNTDGMIPAILDELNPQIVMYLLNAVYFKATWTEKFDPKDTRDMNFSKLDGTTAKRKLMHRKALARYGKNDLCEMLCLPYGSKSWSMYVMLPHEGKTIDDIIEILSAQYIDEQLITMKSHEVDILMPRFTTESETKLEEVLSSMGMPLAFDSDYAEFPNMAQGLNLYVSMMKQKAKIEVNEDGTKAAAVTIAGFTKSSATPQYGKVDFHATRPFVYFIREGSTGSIFFIGTYCGD